MSIIETSLKQDVLKDVKDCIDKVNAILNIKNFNSQNLKSLIYLYEKLYKYTSEIIYRKNIADIYYFYFNQKNKALENYLAYVSKIHNDQTIYNIIASIYKGLKDSANYKKYLDLAIISGRSSLEHFIPDSDDLVLGVNIGVAAGLAMNEDVHEGISTYKKIMEFCPRGSNIIESYIESEKEKAKEFFDKKCWGEALLKYKDIFNNVILKEDEFINLICCLAELKQKDLALEYLSRYEEIAEDKDRANYVVADLLYFKFDMKKEAIDRFERHLLICPNDALLYNTLGHLYAECYGDGLVERQIKYFLKAVEISPNSAVFLKNLALTYAKIFDFENADKYYQQLLKINPSGNDYFDYGCFLIKNGKLKDGYTYLMHRFTKEESPALYPPMLPKDKMLRSLKDISDKTILIQCEQGFGDSIMYARYVKQLVGTVKKVLFVVQDELIDLFNASDLGVELYGYTVDFSSLQYDYHVPIINLPVLFNTDTKNIPYKEAYLAPDEKDVDHYSYEFINHSGNLKIGIAYAGSDLSEDLNRDVLLKDLLPIIKMKNVDVYSLQHSDKSRQIDDLPKDLNVIDLGKDFSTFEDTAAAMMNMDLIITTDNVILNLAGALGLKTFAIFNNHSEYRWFDLTGEDVVWYKSIKPFVAKNNNEWAPVIEEIKNSILG